MAKIPKVKSHDQLLSEMLNTYLSKIGVNDMTPGSAIRSFFETVAQSVYLSSADQLTLMRDSSIDRAVGQTLKDLGLEENVRPLTAKVATGTVTVTDSSFEKISTKVYSGTSAPNAGSTILKVSDASKFPASGALYVGRNTPNIEGPISYSSVTQVGSYYEITLSSPTSKFHNISEQVTLSQGGVRSIVVGTSVSAPTAGSSSTTTFSVTELATILDGEVTVTGVKVSAQVPGIVGNIPKGAIRSFLSAPFYGATVTNELAFSSGRDEESDDELRSRIKRAKAAKGYGTELAIKNATLGASATDENATIISNEIVSSTDSAVLYIDNGQGYEEKSNGTGLEYIVDSALGGESHFQLSTGGTQTSIAKAYLESSSAAPFDLHPFEVLSVSVGGIVSSHSFKEEDFKNNGFASAYEVASSINENPTLLFVAKTSNSGQKLIISAKSELDEDIEVVVPSNVSNANDKINFPAIIAQTLKLYKNKTLLSRNGKLAVIETNTQSDWSDVLTSGETLIVAVDNTAEITYTFTDNDFLLEGTYSTLSKTNSLESWVNVINSKTVGLTASVNGNKIQLHSNLGANKRASVSINSTSSLIAKNMFDILYLKSSGLESDYTLSRNTAQFKLVKALEKGDSLLAGTESNRGYISSSPILGGILTLIKEANLWLVVDDLDTRTINHFAGSDTFMSVSKPSADVVRYTSSVATAFPLVQVGDYVVVWSDNLNVNNRLEGRINNRTNNSIDIKITASEYSSAVIESLVPWKEGISFLRGINAPQKVSIVPNTYTVNQISTLIKSQISGVDVTVIDDEILNIATKTNSTNGLVFLPIANEAGQQLNFTLQDSSASIPSHYAYEESDTYTTDFPLFVHGSSNEEVYANPTTSFVTDFDSDLTLASYDLSKSSILKFKHPFSEKDAQSAESIAQIRNFSGNNIEVSKSNSLRRLRLADRFYLANQLDLSQQDQFVAILDGDVASRTFPIPAYRNGKTNATAINSPSSFRLYDVESGPTVEFSQNFPSFDFSNYKTMLKAKCIIDPSPSNPGDAVIFRSTKFGLDGERISVGYSYPTAANSDIKHVFSQDEKVKILISLKSDNSITTQLDATTSFDVLVSPMGGYDSVTFNYNGTGTSPGLSSVSTGDYVNINASGEFSPANIGSFKVVSATATSFTVKFKSGLAIAEINKATLTNNTITFFKPKDTTAAEIVDYVNLNLYSIIEAAILPDTLTDGSGIITTSTIETSSFVSDSNQMVDGLNYILTSAVNVSAPNTQFTFKDSLSMYKYDTLTVNAYSFNNGEEVRLIPTTHKQLKELLSILAVTGFTSLGKIDTALKDTKIQLSTNILGSNGSIQLTGGTASYAQASAENQSVLTNNNFIKTSISKASANGFHSKQWVRVAASNVQKKVAGLNQNNSIQITPGFPLPSQSTIKITNKSADQVIFGQPNASFRDEGRNFIVEKQGVMACFIWDGVGASPFISKAVEMNNSVGDIVCSKTTNGYLQLESTTGSRNFAEVSVGDKLTLLHSSTKNSGTFDILNISSDKKSLVIDNVNGIASAAESISPANFTIQSSLKEGNVVKISTGFSAANQGTFNIVRVFDNSFYVYNPIAKEEEVTIATNGISISYSPTSSFDVTVNGNMRIDWNGTGTTPSFSNLSMGDYIEIGSPFNILNQGMFLVTSVGDTFIECANALAIAETNKTSAYLFAHSPSISITDYESTGIEDSFVISGLLLGEASRGSYIVSKVNSESEIIVEGLIPAGSAVLANESNQFFVQEHTPYVGYKKIYSVLPDMANSNSYIMTFDTKEQFLKINNTASTTISAISKIELPILNKKGLDAYRFHEGLLAVANKIIYGDSRDTTTYPGVAAAGAEIYVESPLVRRVKVSISVRINTGVPFIKISEQIRSNIASVINGNFVGQPIAISTIIASVNSIPGVKAVSIIFPNYNVTNDLISVAPSEKTVVLDIVNDIVVTKNGD